MMEFVRYRKMRLTGRTLQPFDARVPPLQWSFATSFSPK
jgi:hypothetical protein